MNNNMSRDECQNHVFWYLIILGNKEKTHNFYLSFELNAWNFIVMQN